jgi:hypothetical protein
LKPASLRALSSDMGMAPHPTKGTLGAKMLPNVASTLPAAKAEPDMAANVAIATAMERKRGTFISTSRS